MSSLEKDISSKILTTFFYEQNYCICAAKVSTMNKIIGCVSNTPVFPLFN